MEASSPDLSRPVRPPWWSLVRFPKVISPQAEFFFPNEWHSHNVKKQIRPGGCRGQARLRQRGRGAVVHLDGVTLCRYICCFSIPPLLFSKVFRHIRQVKFNRFKSSLLMGAGHVFIFGLLSLKWSYWGHSCWMYCELNQEPVLTDWAVFCVAAHLVRNMTPARTRTQTHTHTQQRTLPQSWQSACLSVSLWAVRNEATVAVGNEWLQSRIMLHTKSFKSQLPQVCMVWLCMV